MSWEHVFKGPTTADDDNPYMFGVTSKPDVRTPVEVRSTCPYPWTDPETGIVHQIEHVGSGRPGWWNRTYNQFDPLVTPWMALDVLPWRPRKNRVLP